MGYTTDDLRLFDEIWYLSTYADVAQGVADGAFDCGREHYENFGRFEGRLPGPPFKARDRGGSGRHRRGDCEAKAVLGLGGGQGFFCLKVARAGAALAGVDFDSCQVRRDAARLLELAPETGTLRCGDWIDLGCEKFDPIFCVAALEYAEDQANSAQSPEQARWCRAWTTAGCPG